MAGEHIYAPIVHEGCRVGCINSLHDGVVCSGKANTSEYRAEEKKSLGHGGDARDSHNHTQCRATERVATEVCRVVVI